MSQWTSVKNREWVGFDTSRTGNVVVDQCENREWVGFETPCVENVQVDQCEKQGVGGWDLILPVWEMSC